MGAEMNRKSITAAPIVVRRIMRKHGLPEPTARAIAALAFGDVAVTGGSLEKVTD